MSTPDTDNNIIVGIEGGTAVLGTDYNTAGVSPNIHLPLSKVVWGDENVSRRVSTEYPMPVDIRSFIGNSGAGFLLGITGSVYGSGTFNVGNTSNNALWIRGTGTGSNVLIKGSVEGISGGTPVSVSVLNNIGIFGVSGATAITITGGRNLSYSLDNVNTRTTIVGLSLNSVLGFTQDSVRVWGPTGQSFIPASLNYMAGITLTPVGGSGGALNVNVLNTAFGLTLQLSALIGVTNSTSSPLRIQGGTTFNSPVLIRWHGLTGPLQSAPVTVGNTVSVSMISTGNTFATDFAKIINATTGTTGAITSQLNAINTNTATVSAINDKLTTNGINVKVIEITKQNQLHSGVKIFQNNSIYALTIGSVLTFKSGINLKAPTTNTRTIFVGNQSIVSNPGSAYPLDPGESLFLDCNSTNLIFCFAPELSENQKIFYIGS